MEQRPTSRWEKARLEIARQHLERGDALTRAIERAERISASTLEVARVGVWLLSDGGAPERARAGLAGGMQSDSADDSSSREAGERSRRTHHTDDRAEIRTEGVYDRRLDGNAPARTLDLRRYPTYAQALSSRRVVRADDALLDPRTSELGDDYLRPEGIGAMLDAPVFRGGEVIGVVCHEHVGGPRAWTDVDVNFAVSVADMLGALFEQADRLAAQERVARAERMQALGRLATAVAHDVTNVLTAVSLTAHSILAAPVDRLDGVHQGARDILAQCDLGANMARRLLRFARAQPGEASALEVEEVVRALAELVTPLVRARADLQVQVEGGPHRVLADRTELEQALMNLVVNARDAIPPDRYGSITVRVSGSDGHVRIAVTDDGVGMDAATCERAFEPFFTTKPGGQGTGMGLATVYGTVAQAGGTTTITSDPGRGTTVAIELPRLPGAPH